MEEREELEEAFKTIKKRVTVALDILEDCLERDDGTLAGQAMGDLINLVGPPQANGYGGMLLLVIGRLLSPEAAVKGYAETIGAIPTAVPPQVRYKSAAELRGVVWDTTTLS